MEQKLAALEQKDSAERKIVQSKKVDISDLRKNAIKGDCTSMIELGDLYYNGTGVTQNRDEARMWYKKAADKGSVIGKEKYEKAFPQIDMKDSKTTKKTYKVLDQKGIDEVAEALLGYTVVNGKLVRREEAERQSNKKRK